MPLSQSNIKFINSLSQKKFRQSYHKFTVEGSKILGELLSQDTYKIHHLYALNDWLPDIHHLGWVPDPSASELLHPSGRKLPLTILNQKELARISQLTTPNKVIAIVEMPQYTNEAPSNLRTSWSLYLDGIQSPANLGAILRVADWFGFQYVFGGPGTADLYSSKTIQASMGTFLRIQYRETSLETLLNLQEPIISVLAADLQGQNVFNYSPPKAGILVIGNEGQGLRPETRALVTDYLLIPKATGRKAESLNAAVAAGIICAAIRQS